MNKLKFFLGAGVLALAISSCSDNEINTEGGKGEDLVEAGFQKLGTFTFESESGENTEEGASSRTPNSVDEYDRPSGNYPLDFVGMFSVDIADKTRPGSGDVGQVADVEYTMRSGYQEYVFNNNELNLSYIIETGNNKQPEGCTINGTLTLSDGSKHTEVQLSVIETDKLTNHIKLNDFYYEGNNSIKPRGSSLYFSTYNPNKNTSSTNTLSLPELTSEDLGASVYKTLTDTDHSTLYDEYSDRLFLSSELLVFATKKKIYFYEVVLKEGSAGGYHLYKTYDRDNSLQTSSLGLRRLTSIVNASFMLIDQQTWDENSYFKMSGGKGDMEASEKAYFNAYGVNLKGMTCNYATMDGINTVYDINDRTTDNNTSKIGRLVLWADGYQTTAADGNTYDKRGEYSAELSYALKEGKVRGLGIRGHSYSVVFKGDEDSTAGESINFYVTVDGVKVKVTATINLNNGITLEQNKTHNIMVMVNAEDFANYVKELKTRGKSRAGSNEYATFEVPAGSVVVQ